ncbi:MAG: S46 family peptidase, partial [Bacteroidales bacterium]
IEKEDSTNYEFIIPKRLKDISQNKDYGNYSDENGDMRLCFISTNDITGGNSGSPILNDKGEIVGVAFDGNWEAMSGDIIFEPQLQRTISVDIRYILM